MYGRHFKCTLLTLGHFLSTTRSLADLFQAHTHASETTKGKNKQKKGAEEGLGGGGAQPNKKIEERMRRKRGGIEV